MTQEKFEAIMRAVINAGYAEEIEWQRTLKPCDNHADFACETIWVILNSGMKEQIARKIWDRIQQGWLNGLSTADCFNHKGKVKAIDYVSLKSKTLFASYQDASDKIAFLQTIPFIGKITCFHLAKNLGHDCVKPDRHLVRIASVYNTTPDQLCEALSKSTGQKKCVIDIVIWRACNLKII